MVFELPNTKEKWVDPPSPFQLESPYVQSTLSVSLLFCQVQPRPLNSHPLWYCGCAFVCVCVCLCVCACACMCMYTCIICVSWFHRSCRCHSGTLIPKWLHLSSSWPVQTQSLIFKHQSMFFMHQYIVQSLSCVSLGSVFGVRFLCTKSLQGAGYNLASSIHTHKWQSRAKFTPAVTGGGLWCFFPLVFILKVLSLQGSLSVQYLILVRSLLHPLRLSSFTHTALVLKLGRQLFLFCCLQSLRN